MRIPHLFLLSIYALFLNSAYAKNNRKGLPTGSPTPAPVHPPTPMPTPTRSPTPMPQVGGGGGGSRTCFSSEDRLTLESGEQVKFVELSIGDRILSADRDGTIGYSPVVFLPHKENDTPTTFLEVVTNETNKKVKMTRGHLIIKCDGTLVKSHQLVVGDCLRTIDGEEKVNSLQEVRLPGVYTAVAQKEFLVVNGIISSPFASSSALAHAYYNSTDMEDWCSSNNWLVFDQKHHHPMVAGASFSHSGVDGGGGGDGGSEASQGRVSPSEDCMSMLTEMFKKYKNEPIGWGVDGWGYRNWANPISVYRRENDRKIPPLSLITGWQ
jgi:hypothetical protein